ncbi:MAG: RDD family protein [Deltaproteobacteria bacterium]|nr:RDD family protein [Deltaproteobacteria bacterium]
MNPDQTRKGEGYRVVFVGLLDPSEDNVRAFAEELSAGFRISLARAVRIVRNAPMIIKKGVSRSKAERYEHWFAKRGARIRIEETHPQAPAISSPAGQPRAEGFETTAIQTDEPTGEGSAADGAVPRDESVAKAYDDEIAAAYDETFTPPSQSPPRPQGAQAFRCPQCGQEQERGTECVRCGIIFEKYERIMENEEIREAGSSRAREEEEPAADGGLQIKIEPAGFWVRLAAYAVDGFVINLGMGMAALLLFFLLVKGGGNFRGLASLAPTGSWIVLSGVFAYHIYFLGKRGYTPGKGFLKLQVIRQDGTGMSYGDAAIRTFSYTLSSIPFYLGFLWIGFDAHKQGWHDKIAKTQVIKAEETPSWRKWVVLVPAVLLPMTAVIGAVGIPAYRGYASRADVARAVNDLQTLKSHLEEHFYRYDRYPLTGEFGSFLTSSLGRIPRDPFNHGRPYRYVSDGSSFTLWSIGPDGVDNGARIAYDPLFTKGLRQKGDIIVYSDEGTSDGGELFGMTPSPS